MNLSADKHEQRVPSSDNAGDKFIATRHLSTSPAAKQKLLSVGEPPNRRFVPMVFRSLSP